MSNNPVDENFYEQTLIGLFKELGYDYECGYDVERDFREPYYVEDLQKALKALKKHNVPDPMCTLSSPAAEARGDFLFGAEAPGVYYIVQKNASGERHIVTNCDRFHHHLLPLA